MSIIIEFTKAFIKVAITSEYKILNWTIVQFFISSGTS
jgi:hypothetical protein